MEKPSGKVTVREATIDLLRRLDMTTVFGNPGSTELPFLSNWPNDFRYVLGLQEASVVAMADGYARATGRAAFCNLHSAAGVGHALGSVFTAFRNQAPLVISAGQQARSLLPLQPFLGATEAANFPKPYVKWSCEPARAEDVPAALAQAYYIAMQRPRGPTFVSVPMDDWDRETLQTVPRTVSQDSAPDPMLIDKLAATLQKAKRPVIVIGPEIDDEGAADQAVTLAEALGAPVWVSPFSSRASFPELHPNFAGFLPAAPQAISATLSEYDVVVVLGAPVFTFHVVGDCPLFRGDVSLFQITGDGAAAAASPIGTGIVGSVRLSLAALLQQLPVGKRNTTLTPRPRDIPLARDPIPAAYLLHAIAKSMPADTILVEEAPSHRPLMHRYLPIATPGNFFTMASGGLGYGLPAAVGVALARPGRRVVCLIGDGSLMYSIQALWTAAQLKLPVSVIVINNSGYGAMRSFMQTLNVQSTPGIDLPGIDPARIAEGFECSAARVTEAAGLEKALAEALSQNGPSLLDVIVDPDVPKLY
ncbi:benzoylformate decarboxylase [Variibacter gotjawalensis]|uniref:Benzoylformate decarboxylase n=1 Tax=Variibacter gotjawalensis TaxID=1333996 RepID=A0A0S3Q051_9BRAD|nr:benzoylformate decarboxylase [Variibacter gotjawalensis]NIK47363.1 benzoylformate decarboxylase [Variibacter gotjawalensis]RZS49261.1 benzoylformate decarboxylase [Variibacter gotjawalensis]BAT61523.1 benzoylformate decarboxylase [Variibacter gotjawalensis]